MSAQHSRGPWSFYTKPQPNGCPIIGANGLMVAMLAHSINYEDQREQAIANARLIAAAPDLLEALKLAHKALEAIADEMTVGERYTNAGQHLLDSLEPSRAAIAKATGQKGGA